MKKQYTDPLNYKLTASDIENSNYGAFLDDLTDVPSSVALRPYSIDKAGIVGQSAYIKVRPFDKADDTVPMFINLRMEVELHNHRGIHMSRCQEALYSLVEETHDSLDDFTEKLAKKILGAQASEKATVSAEGTYIHKRPTPKTQKVSHDQMILRASSVATAEDVKSKIGLSVFIMTGCPCTETFMKFAVVPELKASGFDLTQIAQILEITHPGTHTQRGLATINIDKETAEITHKKLHEILDTSCLLIYELLKRPDEHQFVLRVLNKPQFAEDVVRDIVDKVIQVLGSELEPSSKIFASSKLFDSIHIHNVYSEVEKEYRELVQENKT